MKRILTILVVTVFLSASAFFCSKPKSVAPASDSSKTLTSAETPRPYLQMVQPLPEADTIPQARYALSFFLRNSEVWAVDTITNGETQLTFTKGNIRKFYSSPSHKYLACERLLAITNETEKGYLQSLMIIRPADHKLIREFDAPPYFDRFLAFRHWISNSRFLCTTSDANAVDAYFVYDAYRDSLQRVPEDFGWTR